MSFFKKFYKQHNIATPSYHFVLGSGFSPLLDQIKQQDVFKSWSEKANCLFCDVPNLASPSVASHQGSYRFFVHKHTGLVLSLQCGRLHLYEGHSAQDVVTPVMQIRLAGTKNFVLSNISGSLKKAYKPGDVVALKDHVNMTNCSPLIPKDQKANDSLLLGDRFPDMSQIYDSLLREQISAELTNQSLKVHTGVYVGLLGPELETPAQISWLNHSSNGAFDVVGMSTVLEAIALKQAGARLAAFSLVSNFAAGVAGPSQKELSFRDMCKHTEPYVLKILRAWFCYAEKC